MRNSFTQQLLLSFVILLGIQISSVFCSDVQNFNVSRTSNYDESRVPEKVISRLRENISDLSSSSYVWTQKRSSQMDIDSFIKKVKGGAGLKNFFEPEKNVLMWQDGFCFLHTVSSRVIGSGAVELDDDGRVKNTEKQVDFQQELIGFTTAMDADNYYIGESEKDTDKSKAITVFSRDEVMKNRSHSPVFLQSYLPFIGLKVPTYGAELQLLPSSYILFLLENGRLVKYSEDIVDGEQLSRIDIESDALILNVSYELLVR